LRVGAAIPLICLNARALTNLNSPIHLIQIAGGILLVVGLWAPVAGAVLAIVELWSAFSLPSTQPDEHWIHLLLATVAGAVAMIGPGALSIDSRLFGRRRFDINGSGRNK
jgi:putative oxidoreductase